MAAETQYTANTGLVKLANGNSSLTGAGTVGTDLYEVLTAASNGTLIKTVTIKATGSFTTQGMIRLFIYDGTNTRLLKEIEVPANTQSATNPAFETTIELNYKLKATYRLRATTQNAENFNVIAEGLDFAYYTTSVRPESTNYTANTGVGYITGGAGSGNTSLSGSGTVGTDIWSVLTAGAAAAGWKGTCIESITIKATGTVTAGMVRVFISNGGTGASNTFLLTEVFVPGIVPQSTFETFGHKISFPNKFQLKADYKILVTSQNNSESFAVIAEAMDWKYPA